MSTFLYAIGAKTGNIKIGWSSLPYMRLTALQTGNPRKLEILAEMYGTFHQEQEIHRFMIAYARGGEWFKRSAEIKSLVEKMKTWPNFGVMMEQLAAERKVAWDSWVKAEAKWAKKTGAVYA